MFHFVRSADHDMKLDMTINITEENYQPINIPHGKQCKIYEQNVSGEIVQLIQYLSCKHENLNLIPITH